MQKLMINWLEQFDKYYKQAKENNNFDVTAVRLATCDRNGFPSCRMVLLKKYDDQGFTIYTNFEGRKGRELLENPKAALYFYWPEINVEIITEGKVKMVSDNESDAYFQSRAFFSKIGAHASRQSRPMFHSIQFFARIFYYWIKFSLKGQVDRPKYWRGFKIIPDKIEFKKI